MLHAGLQREEVSVSGAVVGHHWRNSMEAVLRIAELPK
jgi:hypothetical protein